MSNLLLMTNSPQASVEVLPSLSLLPHHVRVLPPEVNSLLEPTQADVVLLDCRRDLVGMRGLARTIRASGAPIALLLVLTEGGMAAVTGDWGGDDVIVDTAGPAELDARLRLLLGMLADRGAQQPAERIRRGALVVDEAAYAAKVDGKPLNLTFKEFELLRFLAHNPGRVFTREQLLAEVWGYDYFGGTRTIDVHIRRLRAKLGEHDAMIGTVRNVGYRFVRPRDDRSDRRDTRDPAASGSADRASRDDGHDSVVARTHGVPG